MESWVFASPKWRAALAGPSTLLEPVTVQKVAVEIENILKEALDNKIISREEYTAMRSECDKPSKFYCNFKIHKKHKHGETPPVRPIVSASGSLLENIGKYVASHIKQSANKQFIVQTRHLHLKITLSLRLLSTQKMYEYIFHILDF